jgi:hypothetical protein
MQLEFFTKPLPFGNASLIIAMKRFEALKCGISEPQTNTEIFQKH